jgi:DNA primase
MLKRQLLGEIASRAALPLDEIAAAWRTSLAAASRPSPPVPARRPRRGPRPAMWQPADRIAWMLLLESRWWEGLTGGEHALLCALPGWHGELFRFLDREATEHGAQPWAVLRERIGDEAWAASALALVDAEDPAIEPVEDDLARSIGQLRSTAEQHDAMRVLGRI